MTSLLCTALSAALALAGPAGSRDGGSAADAVARAEAAYLAQDWTAASKAFAEAYEIEPNPVYLYARAQAERLAGQCPVALQLYDSFLETDPPAEAAQEARINRARCEAAVETPPPPQAPGPDPDASDGTKNDGARPWYRDPAGGALVGVGAVTTAIGGGLLGIALANDGEATAAETEDGFIAAKDDAKARYSAGVALTSIGAALLVAGAIRWIVVAKRGTRPKRTALGPTGFTVRF